MNKPCVRTLVKPPLSTCLQLAGASLSAVCVHPWPQLLDGGSRCNFTFASPCRDEALQFKGHSCRPDDVSPLVLACFLGSHLRCKLCGSWFISSRIYTNEGTTLDRHHQGEKKIQQKWDCTMNTPLELSLPSHLESVSV